MAWSKRTRIMVMLALDAAFFFVELVAGIATHSLALQADAFHMLNDIISLVIGLWAVTVASKATTDKYSYGLLRAEIIGAFFNAVFLIALCISIILEVFTRFIEPPEIGEPRLVLIVGCFGLCSNLVGFVVLGGHGHGHSSSHSHDKGHHVGVSGGQTAEHGHVHAHIAEEGRVYRAGQFDGASDPVPDITLTRASTGVADSPRHIRFETGSDEEGGSKVASRSSGEQPFRSRRSSFRQSRLTNIDDISIYPASFRQEIIAASREPAPVLAMDPAESHSDVDDEPNEVSALLKSSSRTHTSHTSIVHRSNLAAVSHSNSAKGSHGHTAHDHTHKPRRSAKGSGGKSGHSHSHGDMGMNAMVLHVLGDALGNVGVIATALVVWLSSWSWRNYADPAVSLLITVIILRTALPLTLATARILLQATPDHIDVPRIREDIEALDGVVSCHHMHIWQLSDDKLVASMHVRVGFSISDCDGRRYMELDARVRECLHEHGIHSATIQPEFCPVSSRDDGAEASASAAVESGNGTTLISHSSNVRNQASSTTITSSSSDASPKPGHSTEGPEDRYPSLQQPRPSSGVHPRTGTAVTRPSSRDACLVVCVQNCDVGGCCSSVGGMTSKPVENVPGSGDSH